MGGGSRYASGDQDPSPSPADDDEDQVKLIGLAKEECGLKFIRPPPTRFGYHHLKRAPTLTPSSFCCGGETARRRGRRPSRAGSCPPPPHRPPARPPPRPTPSPHPQPARTSPNRASPGNIKMERYNWRGGATRPLSPALVDFRRKRKFRTKFFGNHSNRSNPCILSFFGPIGLFPVIFWGGGEIGRAHV